jgi:hypothetical protein
VTARINSTKNHEGLINNSDQEERTYNETVEFMKKLKPNRAAGHVEIFPEFKNKMEVLQLKMEITPINSKDLETRQKPYEWTDGILYPVYKKWDKTQRFNYRGISILNTTKNFCNKLLLYNPLSLIFEPNI